MKFVPNILRRHQINVEDAPRSIELAGNNVLKEAIVKRLVKLSPPQNGFEILGVRLMEDERVIELNIGMPRGGDNPEIQHELAALATAFSLQLVAGHQGGVPPHEKILPGTLVVNRNFSPRSQKEFLSSAWAHTDQLLEGLEIKEQIKSDMRAARTAKARELGVKVPTAAFK